MAIVPEAEQDTVIVDLTDVAEPDDPAIKILPDGNIIVSDDDGQ